MGLARSLLVVASMTATASLLVAALGLGGCGARTGFGLLEPPPDGADGDADADADGDADTDGDGDGDGDAPPPPDCGDRPACAAGEICCEDKGCLPAGGCCDVEDCASGLACLPGDVCGVGDLGCGIETLEVEPVPPNMMILLDRSGSMAFPIGGRRKWDVAVDALDAVVTEYEDRVRFGLSMMPGPTADCSPAEVDVAIDDTNASAILEVLRSSEPLVTTPIADSLDALEDGAGLDDPERRNLVLLVSDGEESCGGSPIVQTQHLYDEDPRIQVYVVGFGTEVDDESLAGIAEQARTERAGEFPYWTAEDGAGLREALSAIVRSVVPCGFALSDLPPAPERLWVWLDGATAVPRDASHADGWDYDEAGNVLTFYGPACETVRTDQHAVQVVFGCRGR